MNVFVQSIVFCGVFATNGFVQDYKTHQVVSDFECGDLLYGLQDPVRAWYLPAITQKICRSDNPFYFTEEPKKVEASASVSRLPKPNISPKRIVYCTADVYNKRLDLYEGTKTALDEQYATYMEEKGLAQFGASFENEDPQIKFLCKNAIDFTMSQGKKIRFLLDRLDMRAVVLKEKRLGLSFTSVELRYVYRHWKKFREHVVFYEQGQRLETAPWESDPKVWKIYDTHRQDKEDRLKRKKARPAPAVEEADLYDFTEVGTDAGSDALADLDAFATRSMGNPHKRMKLEYLRRAHLPLPLTPPPFPYARRELFSAQEPSASTTSALGEDSTTGHDG